MLVIGCVINNVANFMCDFCGSWLFDDTETRGTGWEFCPFCGEPLYNTTIKEHLSLLHNMKKGGI